MAILEIDELLDIQTKHQEATKIFRRVEYEIQRRLNQDQIDAMYGSAWLGIVGVIAGTIVGGFSAIFASSIALIFSK